VGVAHSEHGVEYFLNVTSAGIGGDVAERVNRRQPRRVWTFLQSSLEAILHYQPQSLRVELDGQLWAQDVVYIIGVANGTTFGSGMQVAPNARPDDGWLDVVMMTGSSRRQAVVGLMHLYRGTHVHLPFVRVGRAQTVRVLDVGGGTLPYESDGEGGRAQEMAFSLLHGALMMLM
jgi:diacylglycerol kinase (ATP)